MGMGNLPSHGPDVRERRQIAQPALAIVAPRIATWCLPYFCASLAKSARLAKMPERSGGGTGRGGGGDLAGGASGVTLRAVPIEPVTEVINPNSPAPHPNCEQRGASWMRWGWHRPASRAEPLLWSGLGRAPCRRATDQTSS